MGFLLLQYEYQRANYQHLRHERTGIRLNDQLQRYTTRIEKMNTVFSKAQSRLENKYSQMNNMMNNRLSSAANMIGNGDPLSNIRSAICSIVVGGVNLGRFVQFPSIPSGTPQQEILAQMTQIAANAKTALAQLIANAQEADTEKLQAQQNAQLEPISEKEGDLKAKQSTNDILCDLWQERAEKAKSKLPDAIKGSVGGYGMS